MFEGICSFKNLLSAYLKARKCKRYRNEILEFSYNLEENLLKLQKELQSQTYQHGGYREFIVCDLKKRHIKAAPFRDRVVHHALCNFIEPIFDKGFIYDSYACRKEKGTHKAIKRLDEFIKSANTVLRERESKFAHRIYCLKGDISKYFDSINHEVLLEIIKKKIFDEKVLWLIEEILNSSEERQNTGIPIGNLTSQLFANIYLNELDQFVKHKLRIKQYVRYMDDFLILNFGKKELQEIKKQIQDFLQDKLKLELHSKKANVFPIDKGIEFLGYVIFRNYSLLRKSTVRRFKKRIRFYQKMLDKKLLNKEKFDNSLQSWIAYAEHGNSWNLRKNLSEKLKIKLLKN